MGAQRYVPAPEIIISRISRICYRTSVLRNTLLVARGRIFGEGCPNLECHAPTGFRANRRERTSGPDEGGGTAKQKDGVCPTTLDRAFCHDQKEEFAVQQSSRTSPPFPDVSPKACGGRAEGPQQQGRRPAVAGHTVRDNKPEQISLLFQVNF